MKLTIIEKDKRKVAIKDLRFGTWYLCEWPNEGKRVLIHTANVNSIAVAVIIKDCWDYPSILPSEEIIINPIALTNADVDISIEVTTEDN